MLELRWKPTFTQVSNGIARCMALSGLKKALSLEAVRLASKERVQQRLPLGLRAADGGSVEGSAEDSVESKIQRRTVEQIVDLLALVLPERIFEVPKISLSSLAQSRRRNQRRRYNGCANCWWSSASRDRKEQYHDRGVLW